MRNYYNTLTRIATSLILGLIMLTPSKASEAGMKAWHTFRNIHSFGYQAVSLKHEDGKHIFIISEPSSYVKEDQLKELFSKFRGEINTVKHPIGHDGWLCDIIGEISFNGDNDRFDKFSKELFSLLFGSDYKSYFIDLDQPEDHIYYSTHRLNYSVAAAEIEQWFIKDNESLTGQQGKCNIKSILSSTIPDNNALYYSQDNCFVIWALNKNTRVNNDLFRLNARRFAIDSDLIIGALGTPGGNYAIIARKRQVPVIELPPLRAETLALLIDTSNEHLAQSYERNSVFAGKQKDNWDVAPIYLSPELQHTEYGVLLNNTDQMLKSWSENGAISYQGFPYPSPVFWGFNKGAYKDLNVTTLTYNWNTSGAGYVIQNEGNYDIYAINRTGCLPVSFIPSGMEGKIDQKVNNAEELAYDFFSDLQNVDLVRVVQYAAVYQIASHFNPKYAKKTVSTGIDYTEYHKLESSIEYPRYEIPKEIRDSLFSRYKSKFYVSHLLSYKEPLVGKDDSAYFIGIITDLLRAIDNDDSTLSDQGFVRFSKRSKENGPEFTLSKLKEADPYGCFIQYIDGLERSVSHGTSESSLKDKYLSYLQPNVDTVKNYISRYKTFYKVFPYDEAASFLFDRNESNKKINQLQERKVAIAEQYRKEWDELNLKIDEYNEKVNAHNRAVKSGKSSSLMFDSFSLDWTRKGLEKQSSYLNKKIAPKVKKAIEDIDNEIIRTARLFPNESVQLAVGSLNWLLTDPDKYEAPVGDYYACRFNSHRTWIKTPSIVQSTNQQDLSSYGGHNLDAHITPIKVSQKTVKSIPKGYCQVIVENGNRIINVSGADKARLTPATLRTIERKAIEGTFRLPDAPPIRTKSCIQDHSTAVITDKTALIGGKKITDAELMEQIGKGILTNGTSPVKEIRFTRYDARRVRAFADNLQDMIIERSIESNLSLKDFNINEDIQIITGEDGTSSIIIKQIPSTISVDKCIDAELILTVPEKDAPKVKKSLINIFSKPAEEIDNPFKWERQLRLDLESTLPEFDFYDIINEYHQVYSFIINSQFKHYEVETFTPEYSVSDFAA